MRGPGPRHEGERLSAFLDDELTDDQAIAVTRHLAACDACLEELEDLRAAREALRGLRAPEAPLSFMVQTVVLPAGAAEPDPSWPRVVTAVGTVSTVLVLVVLALGGGAGSGTVVPPVERFVADHVGGVEGGPVLTPVRLDPVVRR